MNSSRKFLSWLLVVLMFCAVVSGGCGGSDNDSGSDSGESSGEETARLVPYNYDGTEESTQGRNADGWEDMTFDSLQDNWRFEGAIGYDRNGREIGGDNRYPNRADEIARGHLFALITLNGGLFWSDYNNFNDYKFTPIYVRFVQPPSYNYNEWKQAIIIPGEYKQVADNVFETERNNGHYDQIHVGGAKPGDNTYFFHVMGDTYIVTTLSRQ